MSLYTSDRFGKVKYGFMRGPGFHNKVARPMTNLEKNKPGQSSLRNIQQLDMDYTFSEKDALTEGQVTQTIKNMDQKIQNLRNEVKQKQAKLLERTRSSRISNRKLDPPHFHKGTMLEGSRHKNEYLKYLAPGAYDNRANLEYLRTRQSHNIKKSEICQELFRTTLSASAYPSILSNMLNTQTPTGLGPMPISSPQRAPKNPRYTGDKKRKPLYEKPKVDPLKLQKVYRIRNHFLLTCKSNKGASQRGEKEFYCYSEPQEKEGDWEHIDNMGNMGNMGNIENLNEEKPNLNKEKPNLNEEIPEGIPKAIPSHSNANYESPEENKDDKYNLELESEDDEEDDEMDDDNVDD